MQSRFRAFRNISNFSIYELVELENLLLSSIFCKTINLKKIVFYIKCVLQSSSRLFETFFAAIDIKRLKPNIYSETHGGKSKITGNFVPVHVMKVHRRGIELRLHSFLTLARHGGVCGHFQTTAALSPRKEHPAPLE
jgi:hypothetical protein